MRLLLQRVFGGARAARRNLLAGAAGGTAGGLTRLLRYGALLRRLEGDTGATGFVQSDGDRLLGVLGSVLAFANMVHFFADKFSGLGGSGFTFCFILTGAIEGSFFWHRG